MISRILKDWSTGVDGITHDPARFLLLGGSLSIIAAQFYAIFKGQRFDPQLFGTGLGGFILAVCGGIWAKRDSEPAPTPERREGGEESITEQARR